MAVKEKKEHKVQEVLSFEERLLRLRFKNSKERAFLFANEKQTDKVVAKQ